MTDQQASRQERGCASCRQRDTHPHHSILVPQGDQLVLTGKHLDCCRRDGCPDGSCDEVLRKTGELRGDALVQALVGGVV